MSQIPDFSNVAIRALPSQPDRRGERAHLDDARRHRRQVALRAARPRRARSLAVTGPGLPPYLRGPYPTMYVQQPWTIRQYAGFSTAEESNAFYRRQPRRRPRGHRRSPSTSPRIAATTAIIRASPAMSAWPAWRSISILDMRQALRQYSARGEMTVSMTMNGAVLPVLALYIVAAEEQGVAQKYDWPEPFRTTF